MAQHIKDITITNFKSIRHQVISGCKRINVFIGYPNVGKSNILEALSLFSLPYLKINGSRKLTDFVRVKNLSELFYDTDINTPIEVTINKNFKVLGTITSEAYYPLEFSYWNMDTELPNRGTVDHPVYSDDVLKIQFNKELKAKFENLPKKIGGSGPFEILKYHFPFDNIKPNKSIYPSLIPPSGNNLFEVISNNSELIELLKTEFKKVGGEYLFDASDNSGKILKMAGHNKFTLPFSSMADTLQRLVFYNAATLSNSNSVLLFEEPEAHMFPPYIAKFMAEVLFDENNNQFFIATHSPFVISDLLEDLDKEELSIYTVGFKDGETTIKNLTDAEIHEVYQYGIDLFFNLESYLA